MTFPKFKNSYRSLKAKNAKFFFLAKFQTRCCSYCFTFLTDVYALYARRHDKHTSNCCRKFGFQYTSLTTVKWPPLLKITIYKYFTDRSKAVLLLLIICVFVSCVSHAFASVHSCLVVTCWERADLLTLVGDVYCIFVTFSCGILGQVWYLIVSFPDLCYLSYFKFLIFLTKHMLWYSTEQSQVDASFL